MQDALEFVKGLEGGWDCIIWDYPYMDIKTANAYQKFDKRNHNVEERTPNKTTIKKSYILQLEGKILEKANNENIWLHFYHQPKHLANFIIWNKEPARTRTGKNILLNVEFITFFSNGYKLSSKGGDKHIYKCLSIPKLENRFKPSIAFKKPVLLFKELLLWIDPKHVLDPFAGSYNSAKACKELGIKIDTCDKYLEPPKILKKDLFNYL